MELAERCPTRLEERLGRNHQNAQDAVIFARNRSTVAASPCLTPTLAQPAGPSTRTRLLVARTRRRERRAAHGAVFAHRRRRALGQRQAGVGALARLRARALLRARAGEHLALAGAARCPGRARAAIEAPLLVSRRDLLQQLSAEQHRRRRRAHQRHGPPGAIEDARHHGHPRRSRPRPPRARAGGRTRRHRAGSRERASAVADLAGVAVGRILRRHGGHGSGA